MERFLGGEVSWRDCSMEVSRWRKVSLRGLWVIGGRLGGL